MTREEATERIKMILAEATAYEDAVCYVTSDDADALNMAIKALEQTSALDKVREEIVHLHDWAFSCEEILRIIDKYKAESEG